MVNELIEIIELSSEERNIEFKSSYNWSDKNDKNKIVKAILGLSNLRDGGYLILGVDENHGEFTPIGLTKEIYDQYDRDQILEYVNTYADPYVELDLFKFEHKSMFFVAIKVKEFSEIPTVCKKDGNKLEAGRIYVRSSRKPETTSALSQTEMREILDVAIEKGIRHFHERISNAKLSVATIDHYNEEVANAVPILSEILESGYFSLIVTPKDYDPNRLIDHSAIRSVIISNQVKFSGWSYPIYKDDIVSNEPNKVKISLVSPFYNEEFHIFKDGLFVHNMGYKNAWNSKDKNILEVESTVRLVTRFVEYFARLSSAGIYNGELSIKFNLNHTLNRELVFANPGRSLSFPAVCTATELPISIETDVTELTSNSIGVTVRILKELFEMFNWNDPSEVVIEELISGVRKS